MLDLAPPQVAAVATGGIGFVAAYVRGLLTKAGHSRSAELAAEFALLMDGTIVTSMRERTGEPALRARRMAEMLLLA